MKPVFVFKHEYIIMKKIHTFWIWTQTKYRLNSLNFIENNPKVGSPPLVIEGTLQENPAKYTVHKISMKYTVITECIQSRGDTCMQCTVCAIYFA